MILGACAILAVVLYGFLIARALLTYFEWRDYEQWKKSRGARR